MYRNHYPLRISISFILFFLQLSCGKFVVPRLVEDDVAQDARYVIKIDFDVTPSASSLGEER